MTGAAALDPYLAIILIGALPTALWRVLGVLVGRTLDPRSALLEWARLVAMALVAAVVAKLVLTPTGALAAVPVLWRVGATALALATLFVARRSVMVALIVGEAAIILAAWRVFG